MNAWSTLAALVVVALLVAVAAVARDAVEGSRAAAAAAGSRPPSTPGRQRWTRTGGRRGRGSQLGAVLRAKVEELEKLGVTPDDVVRYIWSMRQGEPPGQLRSAAATALSSRSQQTSASTSQQRLVSDRNLLARHLVRNRTVACNDGSPAG